MLKELGIKITHNLKDLLVQSKKAEADLERLSKKKIDIQVQLDKKKDLQNQMKAIQAEITKINAKKLDIKVKINNVKDQLGEIEKSLTDKKHKIQVSAELGDDSAVSTLFKEIQELERKKIKLSVDVTEGTDAIKRLNQDADELRSKKANIKVQADGIEETKSDLTAVDKQIRDINGRKIKIDAFSAGQSISKGLGYLSDFSNTLSTISFKPIEMGAQAAMDVVERLAATAKGLFNELEGDINMEKVFRQNQALMGVDNKKIDAVYKEMDKYADRTVYNQSEMLNTYNALANSGVKDANKLVKGLGAISATAADSSSAMKAMSLQFSQAMINGLQRTDLRIMAEQTNGGLAVAFKQAGKDFEDFQRRLGDANEKSDPGVRDRLANELNEIVLAAAENPAMNKLAETPKTMGQAYETVIESVINKTRKAFMPLQDVGIKWLNKIANDIGSIDSNKIDELGSKFADFAENKLNKAYEIIKNTDFKKLWSEFKDGFSDGLEGLKKHLGMYKSIFKGVFKIDMKDMNIYEIVNKIGEIIPKLVEYGIKFKEASLLFKGASAGFDVFSTIARYANIKLPFGKLFKGLGADSGQMITAPKVNTGAFKAFAKGLGIIAGLEGTILLGAKALQEVDKIKIGNQLPSKLRNLGLAVAAMGAFAGVVGGLITAFPAGGAALIIGAGTITGISATLAASAKAVKSLDGIKVEGDYVQKVKAIGKVLTELSATTGGLLKNNGFAVLGNFGAMLNSKLKGVSLKEYGKMAETLNSLTNMPEIKTEDIKKKLRAVKTSLSVLDEGEIWHDVPILSNIIDFFNSISAIWEAVKDKANASSLKSFASMMKSLETIQGAENIDTDKIKKNIGTIKTALAAIGETDNNFPVQRLDAAIVNKLFGVISSWTDALKEKGNASKLNSLVSILQSFQSINDVKIDPKKIGKTLKNIKEAIKQINDSELGSLDLSLKQDKKGNIKGLLSSDNTKAISNLGEIVENLKKVMDNINSLGGNIDIANIRTNIPLIGEVIDLLNSSIEKGSTKDMMSVDGFKGLDTRLKSLKTIMENINSLSGHIEIDAIRINIGELKEIFDLLDHDSFRKNNENMMSTDGFKGLKSRIESLQSIMENINSLSGHIEIENILTNIEELRQIFVNLADISGSFENVGEMKESLDQSAEGIVKLAEIANTINGVYINADSGLILEAIEEIRQIFVNLDSISGSVKNVSKMKDTLSKASEGLTSLSAIATTISNLQIEVDPDILMRLIESIRQVFVNLDSISGSIENVGEMKETLTKASEGLTTLATIASTINGLQFEIDPQMVLELVESIRQIFVNLDSISGSIENVGAMQEDLTNALNTINHLSEVIRILNGIPNTPINYDAVYNEIETVRRLLVQINDLPTPVGIEEIQSLVREFENLVNTLNGLAGQFKPVGEGYGKQIIAGFKSVDFEGPATEKVKKLVNKLMTLNVYFREAGKQAGKAYGDGLTSQLESVDVSSAGTKLGNQLKTNLLNSLSGISSAIEESINASAIASRVSSTLSNAASSVRSSSSSSSSRIGPPAPGRWFGGLIGNSTSFAGHETEEIRASKGEFIMPRSSVRKYGTSLMEAMRNLSFEFPTMPALQTVSTSNVSNKSNVDNSNHSATVIIQGAKNDAKNRMRANKYLRSKGL